MKTLDPTTQKIADALRKGCTQRIDGVPEDRHPDQFVNVKATDVLALLDALDAANGQ